MTADNLPEQQYRRGFRYLKDAEAQRDKRAVVLSIVAGLVVILACVLANCLK